MYKRQQLHGALGVDERSVGILELQPRGCAHGQKRGIVGMKGNGGLDGFQGALGRAGEQEHPAERGARGNAVRIRIDGALIELSGLARIAQALVDDAILKPSHTVVRRDLQRVAKFDARLFEVLLREKGFALLQVSDVYKRQP